MLEKKTNLGPKKLLLTGGTGYLGSLLAQSYVERGWEVSILKRESSSLKRLSSIEKQVKLYDVEKFSGGDFNVFLHAATSYGRNGESEEEMIESNIHFPLRILRSLSNDIYFVNIGTSLPKNLNIYARTKSELVGKVRDEFKEISLLNIKLEQFFGSNDGTFISFIINQLLTSTKIDLTPGTQKRDFIYVEDVISAITFLVDKSCTGDYMLGSGNSRTIKSVVELIQMKMHLEKVTLNFGALEFRPNEVMDSKADISKIFELGWRPRYDFESAIEKVISEL